MLIKKVTEKKELQQIESIAKTIWEEHFTPIIGNEQVSYMLQKYQSLEAIKQQIEEGYQYYLFIYKERVIGYMAIVIEKEAIFLSKLYIEKEYRGLGFSKTALQYMERIGKQENKMKIYLTCNKHNQTSLQAYQHLGFEIENAVVTDIGNTYVMDDYILEKKIADRKKA